MPETKEIMHLKSRRSGFKSRITLYKNRLKRHEINSIGEAQSALYHIRHAHSQVDIIQSEIDSLIPEETSTMEERFAFDEEYLILECAILDKINELESSNKQVQYSEPKLISAVKKLPEIDLPKFDGNEINWLPFRDSYMNIIHNDSEISNILKFHYLLAAIRNGKAFRLIETISITNDNYPVAWKTLMDAFNNEANIKQIHLKRLYDIKKTTDNSASSLSSFIEIAQTEYNALKSLNVPVETWDLLLIHHLFQKLDNLSRTELIKNTQKNEILTFHKFINILKLHLQVIKALENVSASANKDVTKSKPIKQTFNKCLITNTSKCIFCRGNHLLADCIEFKNPKNTPKFRYEFVKTNNLCTNCLMDYHRIMDCKHHPCALCPLKHHTLLHFGKHNSKGFENPQPLVANKKCSSLNTTQTNNEHSDKTENESMIATSSFTHSAKSHQQNNESQVVLATAVLFINTVNGDKIPCRALLDSGSQVNFVTYKICQLSNQQLQSTSVQINGINGKDHISKKTILNIESRTSMFNLNLEFLVKTKITGKLPNNHIVFDKNNVPNSIVLADPSFDQPNDIDMLLGAEVYNQIMLSNKASIIQEIPFYETSLGFISIGRIPHSTSNSNFNSLPASTSSCSCDHLYNLVKDFWSIEEVRQGKLLSPEEKLCESHYSQNVNRDKDGRYFVSLPTNEKIVKLGDSNEIALKQYNYLERKLANDAKLREQYSAFMNEYLLLNHMEEVYNPHHIDSEFNKTYYIPHHAVVKESSTTTKLRVVYNASNKTSTHISLNDCLMTGPTIQQDLVSIVVRFRKYLIGFCGDLEKMYRQIRLHTNQRDLHRIWWRDTNDGIIKCYRLSTVTYGTTSASFLAIRTLFQLAEDEALNFPIASKVLTHDFYVDDLLTGANTIEDALNLKISLVDLLKKGGFNLRKISSNNPSLINETEVTAESVSILGLEWNTQNDTLNIQFNQLPLKEAITKRAILSEIAQLFDPLGICSPIIFKAKYFMQTLWTIPNIEWDSPLSSEFIEYWKTFKNEVAEMGNIAIPRCFISINTTNIQLHGFGDASNKGYGCVIYIRAVDEKGVTSCNLVCSKSRVAPIKTQTIPRLELCAALLLAVLMKKIIESLDIKFDKICYWSDSEITLYRIKSDPSKFNTYVANRISQIHELSSPSSWNYVPSNHNPADIVSRGLMPSELRDCALWWSGPDFLYKEIWPTFRDASLGDDLELKSHQSLVSRETTEWEIFKKFSNFNKLLRVTAYILRFIFNCRSNTNVRRHNHLTVDEINNASQNLIKCIQSFEYKKEIRSLTQSKQLDCSSKLKTLSPFIDTEGIIRVGGRLRNTNIPYESKHQILLPSTHPFTLLLIENEHKKLLHAGPQSMLYNLRLKFWIINGRNTCKSIVHKCIMCFRNRPKLINQIMGQLPYDRVNPSRPFNSIGIDFCGPFQITHQLRNKVTTKSYIAVFICFATKAVHFEIVSDLSTQAFISALRRFVARRGKCSRIYSDNATNFVGAKAELKDLQKLFISEIHQNEVLNFCNNEGIEWNTIPPRSPHFGGLWEAAIKSAKHHLKRVLGNSSYTNEQLHTLITQVEACLNSRPLTPMSNDPNDFNPLTPGHFIIGQPLMSIPDPSLAHLNFNKLAQFQRIQYTFQLFWKRWSKEYLTELQQRSKWLQSNDNVKIDKLVLLHEDNIPPLKWLVGKIIKLHPGKDGVVRVVTLKTNAGEFKRAITRISPLPID